VPRLAIPRPAAPRSVGMLALACLMLGCGQAMAQTAAQTAAPFPDPLAPTLETDPRQPPTFQPVTRRQQTQAGQPTRFAPLPSGAGLTGFDASNAPDRAPPPSNAGVTGFDASNARDRQLPGAAVTSANPARADALAATQPAAPPPSPYDAPIPPLPSNVLAAAPPGAPPVSIRQPKKRKAHGDEPSDPYEPAGIHAGSFLLHPAIEFIGGYNSNPGATPGGAGAAVYSVAPELQAKSEWSRHELKADLRGSYTGYSPDETPTLSRPYFNGKVDGRIDVTRDTHVVLGSRALVSTDNPGSPDLQAGLSKLPVFVTYGGSAGIDQSFNRFELRAKGDVERTSYQHSTLTDGSTVSNTDRNYNQIGGTLRGSYETMPGVKPFVEVETDRRVHDAEFDSSGYARNSRGVSGLIGTTFDLRRTLTGEIAVGYTRRTYEDARLTPLEGLIGNASLIWKADALNTVKLSATSTAGESTIAGVSGVLSRDIGLQYDHAFRRWLIGSLKLGFGWDIYKGGTVDSTTTTLCDCVITTLGETSPDRVDKRYSAAVGITYKINRTMQIKGEFRQDWVRSNVSGVDYTASSLLVGLRFQR
jgi:hypothetical protein